MSLQELIGQTVTLTVARKAEFGYFLTDGNEDVLLHINEADREYQEDESVEVFLYVDSEGRTSASTTIPEVAIGKYAWLKVVDSNPNVGVFLDIGIKRIYY